MIDKTIYRWWYVIQDGITFPVDEDNLKGVAKAISALYILEISYLNALGTKTDIQAFADYSVLFVKITNMTSESLDRMFEENPLRDAIRN